MLANTIIIDEFREEMCGAGRIVHAHVYEDVYSWRHITMDGDVMRLEYGNEDGDKCNFCIPISTIQELMRMANIGVAVQDEVPVMSKRNHVVFFKDPDACGEMAQKNPRLADWFEYGEYGAIEINDAGDCKLVPHPDSKAGKSQEVSDDSQEAVMDAPTVDSCVLAMWDELCNRSRIGDVLDDLEDDIRKEIQDSWREHIRNTVEAKAASKGAKR